MYYHLYLSSGFCTISWLQHFRVMSANGPETSCVSSKDGTNSCQLWIFKSEMEMGARSSPFVLKVTDALCPKNIPIRPLEICWDRLTPYLDEMVAYHWWATYLNRNRLKDTSPRQLDRSVGHGFKSKNKPSIRRVRDGFGHGKRSADRQVRGFSIVLGLFSCEESSLKMLQFKLTDPEFNAIWWTPTGFQGSACRNPNSHSLLKLLFKH